MYSVNKPHYSLSLLGGVYGFKPEPKKNDFYINSATIYHPAVYSAHEGRRQLPSENIQLHISNTHLKYRVCITSQPSRLNEAMLGKVSAKQSGDVSFVGKCHVIITLPRPLSVNECPNAVVFTHI